MLLIWVSTHHHVHPASGYSSTALSIIADRKVTIKLSRAVGCRLLQLAHVEQTNLDDQRWMSPGTTVVQLALSGFSELQKPWR